MQKKMKYFIARLLQTTSPDQTDGLIKNYAITGLVLLFLGIFIYYFIIRRFTVGYLTIDLPKKNFSPNEPISGKITLHPKKNLQGDLLQIGLYGYYKSVGIRFHSSDNDRELGTQVISFNFFIPGNHQFQAGQNISYNFQFFAPAALTIESILDVNFLQKLQPQTQHSIAYNQTTQLNIDKLLKDEQYRADSLNSLKASQSIPLNRVNQWRIKALLGKKKQTSGVLSRFAKHYFTYPLMSSKKIRIHYP
ncbi:MAG: hypothetical protein GF332_03980 [Candidatus Moranbacteria bacterium]|nr:hypothetical protein [Candidatus Moranbacteria bacterium]